MQVDCVSLVGTILWWCGRGRVVVYHSSPVRFVDCYSSPTFAPSSCQFAQAGPPCADVDTKREYRVPSVIYIIYDDLWVEYTRVNNRVFVSQNDPVCSVPIQLPSLLIGQLCSFNSGGGPYR